LLRELHELRADPAASKLRGDADRLNVADEGALHVEDEETGENGSEPCDVALLVGIPHALERVRVAAAEREPRLGGRHSARTPLRLRVGGERSDRERLEGGFRRHESALEWMEL